MIASPGAQKRIGSVTSSTPAHQTAYIRLRDMVLFGRLAPGQAVTIEGLVQALGLGMTPVREAIRRLTAEGALQLHGNRRVTVPRLNAAQLDELDFARRSIESRLAEMSLDFLREEDLVRLERIDLEVDTALARGDISDYLEANHRFHFVLYEASGAEVLLGLTRSLWLRFGPSLRVVCAEPGTVILPDRHKDALRAARDGDADALARAIRADIGQGMAQLRARLDGAEI